MIPISHWLSTIQVHKAQQCLPCVSDKPHVHVLGRKHQMQDTRRRDCLACSVQRLLLMVKWLGQRRRHARIDQLCAESACVRACVGKSQKVSHSGAQCGATQWTAHNVEHQDD